MGIVKASGDGKKTQLKMSNRNILKIHPTQLPKRQCKFTKKKAGEETISNKVEW